MGAINSDHAPLLIDTNPADGTYPRPFRFEAMWANDPRSFIVVDDAWQRNVVGSPSYILCKKQSFTTSALIKWNNEVFGHCQTRIKEITSNIECIQCKVASESNAMEEARLQQELNLWLSRNETMWKQKSRETWLREGDRNSRFFHLSSIIRRRRNSIDVIKTDNGEWIVKLANIREFVVAKFQNLFSEEPVSFPENLENLIPTSLSVEENEEICKIPTPLKIKSELFAMQSLKAPGPNGLPPLFYKKYWSIVGIEVIHAVQNFFRFGHMLKEVNNSFIVLIPKVPNPTSVNQFRRISLCNTVYKIIFKLLVARIRPMLSKLVSPCQFAFIPGRWIAENQVVV